MKRKHMLRTILAGTLALGLLAGAVGCGSDSSSSSDDTAASDSADSTEDASSDSGELTTVRVAVMTGNFDHYYTVIGMEEGIFEKYGLEVEVTEFAAGINTVDAIVTEQADIGLLADYALVNRIGNTSEDTDLRVIARMATSSADGNKLYVNPDVITELSDLEGQAIITLPGTVWDYWVGVIIEAAGLTEDDVTILEVDSAQSALAVMSSGEGVAFCAGGVNGHKLEDAGMEAFCSLSEFGLSTDQYYIADEDYIAENGDTINAFYEAVTEIETFIIDNQEESADIIAEELDIDADDVLLALGATDPVLDFTEDTLEHLDEIQKWALEQGSFENSYNMKDFLSLDLLREYDPDSVEL